MSMTAEVVPAYEDGTCHDILSGYLETLALIERFAPVAARRHQR